VLSLIHVVITALQKIPQRVDLLHLKTQVILQNDTGIRRTNIVPPQRIFALFAAQTIPMVFLPLTVQHLAHQTLVTFRALVHAALAQETYQIFLFEPFIIRIAFHVDENTPILDVFQLGFGLHRLRLLNETARDLGAALPALETVRVKPDLRPVVDVPDLRKGVHLFPAEVTFFVLLVPLLALPAQVLKRWLLIGVGFHVLLP